MEELDTVSEALLVFAEFGTPRTKHVDFDAVIGGSIAYEARELLRVASQYRVTLLDGLDNSGAKVDPRNVVAGVEQYLPYLYKITKGMEESGSARIKLNRKLEFSWSSVLLKGAKQKQEFKCGVLVYELCFILTIQALAHYNTAKLLVARENTARTSNLVNAVKELRKGAGILEFVAQVLLPRWVSPPADRPPEVTPRVASAMSGLFLCMAQRITVAQAINKNTPPSALAKLLFGLAERYNDVNKAFRSIEKKTYDTLLETVVDEPPLMAAMCFSLGLRFMGETSRKATKPGEAVAFLQFASDNMTRIVYTPAMRPLFQQRVDAARREVDSMFHEYKADNESIYFEGVPTRDRLETPPGSFIVNPIDYSLPEVSPISFASQEVQAEASAAAAAAAGPTPAGQQEKRKSLSSWFGLGGKKGTSPKAGAAPAAGGAMQAPPGYDKEVFDSLPPDIQQEVLAAHRAGNN